MELHPIWEGEGQPAGGLWHVLSAAGDAPSMRVGHSATFIRSERNSKGKVYVLGGANPSEMFTDIHTLDLDTMAWDSAPSTDFKPRYEHAAFAPASRPGHIYVLLGADTDGNVSGIQALDTGAGVWRTVNATGSAPSPRTHHSCATFGDQCYVFSGGKGGVEPVGDQQTYCFDGRAESWSVVKTDEAPAPAPRHGHAMVAVEGSDGSSRLILVHGGMNGPKFYDDLHTLDTVAGRWEKVSGGSAGRGGKGLGGKKPSARAGHSAVACGQSVFVFGGMGNDTVTSESSLVALCDLWHLDVSTMRWSEIDTGDGPSPACRLDLAACVIRLNSTSAVAAVCEEAGAASGDKLAGGEAARTREDDEDVLEKVMRECNVEEKTDSGDKERKKLTDAPAQSGMLFIHGGMDTQGEIFDDSMLFVLPC